MGFKRMESYLKRGACTLHCSQELNRQVRMNESESEHGQSHVQINLSVNFLNLSQAISPFR